MVYDPKKPPQMVNMPYDPKKDSKKLVNMPYNPNAPQPVLQNMSAPAAPVYSATAVPQSFEDKYKTNIEGLARYNNVDMGAAKDMFISNLTTGGQYKGGGILDYNKAAPDVHAYVSAKAQPSFTPPPSANDTAKAQVDAELAKMIGGINQGYDRQHQDSLALVGRNKQFLESEVAKYRDHKAQDDNSAQTLQNRRGGFYSGGLDYQLGNISKGYAEAEGALSRDINARNNEILSRDRLLGEQVADQISQLQQQAPTLVQQRLQAELDKKFNQNLQVGQLTGSFIHPEAQQAIDTIIAAKDANRYGGNTDASAAANQARATLAALGYNPDMFGADVTYEQAIQNVGKAGTQTLQKQQQDFGIFDANRKFAEGQRQFDVQTEETAKQFAEKMGYDWATLSQRDKESLAQLAISQQNADTSRGQLELAQAESAYKRSVTGKEVDAKTSAGNYADLLGELSHAKTYEEARKYVDSNIDALNEADYRRAMDYLGDKFPNSSPKQ